MTAEMSSNDASVGAMASYATSKLQGLLLARHECGGQLLH